MTKYLYIQNCEVCQNFLDSFSTAVPGVEASFFKSSKNWFQIDVTSEEYSIEEIDAFFASLGFERYGEVTKDIQNSGEGIELRPNPYEVPANFEYYDIRDQHLYKSNGVMWTCINP